MISELISKLHEKTDLTYDEMNQVMTEVLSGKTNDEQNETFFSLHIYCFIFSLLSFAAIVLLLLSSK